jgi:hypothetical protein
MDIRGYETGPITADAAFTSDFAIPDAVDYNTFTSEELDFEPGVKFWDRPFFLGVGRHIWRVIGAYDFTPLATTHYTDRFERWTYTGENSERLLEPVWPTARENAGRQGLASVWLLFQPEQKQIGMLTVAAKKDGRDPADAASRSVTALEQAESVGRFLPVVLDVEKIFDRTSLILAMWLPQSRLAGGAPSAYPAAPVHPLPQVAQQPA